MADRYIKPKVKTVSTGIAGRHIWSARHNHVVIDDSSAHGGSGDAPGAGELFFAGITGCATLMVERLARAANAPLKRVEVSMEGVIDTEARREGPAVFESARLEFVMAGIPDAQARQFVETYKQR
ncbi:MAG TPA: OsmC family protein [Candidatus Binataceae bacterium]|nr:OsmC family protein [Candidatus Binataceae bacterium]